MLLQPIEKYTVQWWMIGRSGYKTPLRMKTTIVAAVDKKLLEALSQTALNINLN